MTQQSSGGLCVYVFLTLIVLFFFFFLFLIFIIRCWQGGADRISILVDLQRISFTGGVERDDDSNFVLTGFYPKFKNPSGLVLM